MSRFDTIPEPKSPREALHDLSHDLDSSKNNKTSDLLNAYRNPHRDSRLFALFIPLASRDSGARPDLPRYSFSDDMESLGRRFELNVNRPVSPQELLKAAKKFVGFSYRLGAKGQNHEIDCSGLITESLIALEGARGAWTNAHNFYRNATELKDIQTDSPEIGDLIFWINKKGVAYHVAIVNAVLNDGKVRVTESSKSKSGYGESRTVDLKKPNIAFGRPIFYG